MERGLANLSLEDREEAFSIPDDVESQSSTYSFYLVGCFLIASVVHFPTIINTMANIWHLLEGVQISDLGEKHFLFKFFNELDINQAITGAPWTFNNHLLIFHRIQENEDPMFIPLMYSDWWVQIHNLPPRFSRDLMAVQFGNFIGKYLEYDMKQLSNGYRNYLCVRV